MIQKPPNYQIFLMEIVIREMQKAVKTMEKMVMVKGIKVKVVVAAVAGVKAKVVAGVEVKEVVDTGNLSIDTNI